MGDAAASRRHLARVLLLLLPACYVALLFATAVHEFLGHGLAAIVVGGRFTGVRLAWDGMGSASTLGPAPDSVASEVSILVAGVVSTCVTGALLLALARTVRNGPARWVLLVFSACLILEGAPYMLWGAWWPDGHGDVARILALLRAVPDGRPELWRAVFVVAGGALAVIGTVMPLGWLLRGLEAATPHEFEFTRARRIVLTTAVGVAGAASWWIFDWEQLVPGVGTAPALTGSLLIAATATWFVCRDRREPRAAVEVSGRLLLAWWLVAVSVAAATLLWLGAGVSWA